MTAKKEQTRVEYEFCTVWEGGNGQINYRTVARDEAEALNNLIDHDPILAAIGCTVAPIDPVNECKIVALVPKSFEHGNDRRNKKIID
jgi:hypothetical protein